MGSTHRHEKKVAGLGSRRFPVLAALSVVALIVAVLLGLVFGASGVGVGDVWMLITGGDLPSKARNILLSIRIPRVLAGVLAGAAFAVSGALIQEVLDNPLASPNIIGANSGAGLAVLTVSALATVGIAVPLPLPAAAFLGALLASALILLVSARAGVSRLTVVLAGVAVNAVFGAGMNAVLIIAPNAYVGSSSYLVGGLSGIVMSDLGLPAVLIAIGLVLACILASRLNVLALGSQTAHALGVPVRLLRAAGLTVASLLAGAAVSFSGLIGFIGLMVPHVARRFVGHDLKRVIPISALWGAAFTVFADLLARTLFAPYELPVGILMALIGGPFFIFLLMKGKGYRDE
ncbi:MAG: FecCD family ABC transporter permease [Atopobiaceae bacterium]